MSTAYLYRDWLTGKWIIRTDSHAIFSSHESFSRAYSLSEAFDTVLVKHDTAEYVPLTTDLRVFYTLKYP